MVKMQKFPNPTLIFPEESPEKRYQRFSADRQFYIEAAKECCRYTIASLLRFFEEGSKNWHDIPIPYQAIGARGVSNLASKLLAAVTPVAAPMFRLIIDDDVLKTSLNSQGCLEEINEGLNAYTEAVQNCIKASGDYAHMFEVWQLLLVSGNVLIADPDDNGCIKVYSLRDFVLKRERSGNVTEIIVRESVPESSLPQKVLSDTDFKSMPSEKGVEKYYDLYTQIVRHGERFYTRQYCRGVIIEGSIGVYPADACPYIPIRMYAGAGEDYSRSFVSNYLGDLKSVDALCRGTSEGAAMASKHIYLVRPDGLTEIKDVEDTPNGGVIYGRADDIGVMQSGKGYDLKIVSEEATKIEKRLSQAFLLLDGGIRNAERVTVAEIKAIAAELETSLGGVYSVMCHSFQMPYIKRKIWKLQRMGKINPLDSRITAVIVTGLEALGMNDDKQKLLEFVSLVEKALGAGAVQYLNSMGFIKRLAFLSGINTEGIINSQEEVEAAIEGQKRLELMSMLAEKAVPAIINNAADLQKVVDNMRGVSRE